MSPGARFARPLLLPPLPAAAPPARVFARAAALRIFLAIGLFTNASLAVTPLVVAGRKKELVARDSPPLISLLLSRWRRRSAAAGPMFFTISTFLMALLRLETRADRRASQLQVVDRGRRERAEGGGAT